MTVSPTGIFDVHTHIYSEQAYQEYQEKAQGRVGTIVTIQDWIVQAPPRRTLDELIDFARPKGMLVMGSINLHFDVPEQLREFENRSADIAGVKMYPGYQHFRPSDSVVDPIAEFCVRHKKPLMFHTGAMSNIGTPLLEYARPTHVDGLAMRYPECKIVIAHFGFPYFLEAATIVSKNPNVYVDISGTIDRMPNVLAHERLVSRYKDDLRRALDYFPDVASRAMFGTDFGGNHTRLDQVGAYVDVVESVFDAEDHDKVFRDTAMTVFG